MERIVLAYSGGLDTSVAIAWLAEQYNAEVIAVTLDLGQGRELTDVRERALAVGAARAHVLDVRDEFARDYILPALQAGALYEDRYPLATALGRPLIARKLVEVAHMEGATTIAHGCNGKANDELRLELGVRALDPSIKVLAPARNWSMTKGKEIEYAKARRIPIPSTIDSPYTVDTNLWGRSIERGVLEDTWQESPEDIYALTRSPQTCPSEPAYVEVEFEQGVPVRANGIEMPLVELIESIETIAGAHGVGRIDMVENATSGVKSREIYEAPAAVVLYTAHGELEKLVIPRDLERLAHDLGRAYADVVYNGRWFSPTREAIDAFMRTIQPRVTGAVRLKLYKGDCRVVGRRSPMALDPPPPQSGYGEAGPSAPRDGHGEASTIQPPTTNPVIH
jgi:argininosuccinate synthase